MRWMWYIAICSLCLGLVLVIPCVRRQAVAGVSVVVYPLLYFQNCIYCIYSALSNTVTSRDELQCKLSWYRSMYEDMRAENTRLRAMCAYARATTDLSSFSRRYHNGHGVIAAVIFRQLNDERHMCILNAGTNRGVAPDMLVVYKDMLVGRVEAVYPYYCRVRLITDRYSHVPVMCAQTYTRAIHCGTNHTNTSTLLYVSHLSPVEVGEAVITRASGMVYPDGFGVGQVVSCTSHGLYHDVVVAPYVNVADIDYCTVIQPGAEHVITSSN